jgi:hypothetical protein
MNFEQSMESKSGLLYDQEKKEGIVSIAMDVDNGRCILPMRWVW